MSRFSLFLPPFAGDYSGVCSVLFDVDCLVVILDAGCCTRNYAEYDEPRWERKRKATFSAQIRTMDAIMGDEEGIIAEVLEAASALEPSCIAVVGTPVPAIVGTDVAGLAAEIEERSGIATLGFPTNGFDTYEKGVSKALSALAKRFAARVDSHAVQPCVNLLGSTPLDDAGFAQVAFVERELAARGVACAFSGAGRYGLADIAQMANASASVAVSWGGLAAARHLERAFGVPCVAGLPLTTRQLDAVAALAKDASARGLSGVSAAPCEAGVSDQGADEAPCVLLVGDQVMMNAVRALLHERAKALSEDDSVRGAGVAVASFFSMDRKLSASRDFALREDGDLLEYARRNPEVLIVGDPLLGELLSACENDFAPLVHPAVSSTLWADAAVPSDAAAWEAWADGVLARLTR